MDWNKLTDNDWQIFAQNWLMEKNNPDSDDYNTSVILLNFMGSANDNWKFILYAFKYAKTDDELGYLAAGPLEHFIGKFGTEYIEVIEELANIDSRFNRLLTGVWKNLSEEEIWNRIRILQKRVVNPLPEYRDD